jgi:hypothetical protein
LLDAILVLKIAIAPVLILSVSYAGKRWGYVVSGWIVSLPLNSAPVIFLLSLERGVGFASTSSEGAILGFASLSAFSFVYSLLSVRLKFGWFSSIIFGWCVFFLFSFILQSIELPLVVAFICVVCWLFLVVKFLPKPDFSEKVVLGEYTNWSIVTRTIAAMSLIFLITEYAPMLGPRLSGLLTTFPIYISVLILSIHRKHGAASTVEFVRGGTVGLFTSAFFFLIVGSLIVGWGIGASYSLAIVASLIFHGCLLKLLTK